MSDGSANWNEPSGTVTAPPQAADSLSTLASDRQPLDEAPARAVAGLYQAAAQALANASHNFVTAQQQASVTAQAATVMAVSTLFSVDTASTGEAAKSILNA